MTTPAKEPMARRSDKGENSTELISLADAITHLTGHGHFLTAEKAREALLSGVSVETSFAVYTLADATE